MELFSETFPLTERKTRDVTANRLGRELINLCLVSDLRIVNGRVKGDSSGEMTYCAANGSSQIDYVLANSEAFALIEHFRVGERNESDHFPLELVLSMELQRPKKAVFKGKECVPYKWDESKKVIVEAKMAKQAQWFASKWDEVLTSGADVNKLAYITEMWMKRIHKPMKCAPKRRKNKIENPVLRDYRREVRMCLSLYRHSRSREDLNVYIRAKKAFLEKRKLVTQLERDERSRRLKDTIKEKDMNKIWSLLRSIMGKRASSLSDASRISSEDWKEHFNYLYNVSYKETYDEWMSYRDCSRTVDELDRLITRTEIELALKGLKGKSAAGPDGLPSEIYKKQVKFVMEPLFSIFNKILAEGCFPKRWSEANIFPIWKGKGSRTDADNYRGIALQQCVGKIFAKILTTRLKKWAEGKNLISGCQAGFRNGFSCIDQIFVSEAIRQRGFRRKSVIYQCYFDYSKAFDSVNRIALLFKLSEMGLSRKFIDVIESMYENCKFAVKVGTARTDRMKSCTGLMQGSQLSPILFILFINDLAEKLRKVKGSHAPGLMGQEVPLLLFADDALILSTSAIGLQRQINAMSEYCEEWGLKVNLSKSKIMISRRGTFRRKYEKWTYRGENMEVVSHYKYLGVLISANGKWNEHVRQLVTKVRFACNNLMRFIRSNQELDLSLFLQLFDALIAPIILYGSETIAWSPTFEKLESLARQFYRKMLGIQSGTSGELLELLLGRPSLRSRAIRRAIIFWRKTADRADSSLVQLAYRHQYMLPDSTECWTKNVKNEIDKMGLGYLWKDPKTLSMKKFKKVINQRGIDLWLQNTRAKAAKLRSARFLDVTLLGKGVEHRLKTVVGKNRRLLIKTMLDQFEEAIRREDGIKLCLLCQEPIDDHTLKHRTIDCVEMRQARNNLLKEKLLDRLLIKDKFVEEVINVVRGPEGWKVRKFVDDKTL